MVSSNLSDIHSYNITDWFLSNLMPFRKLVNLSLDQIKKTIKIIDKRLSMIVSVQNRWI